MKEEENIYQTVSSRVDDPSNPWTDPNRLSENIAWTLRESFDTASCFLILGTKNKKELR